MAGPWDVVSVAPAAPPEDEWKVQSVRPALRRSGWQRFAENVGEGVARSLAGVAHRAADAMGVDPTDVPEQPFGDPIMGAELEARNRALMPSAKPGDAARFERERRQTYARRAAEDPAETIGEKAIAAGGQFAGQLASPESYAGLGAKTLAGQMAQNAAINAAADTLVQGGDMAMDVQDEWEPVQTVAAAAFGAAVPPAMRAVGATARGAARVAEPAVRATARAAGRAAEGVGQAADGWRVATVERLDQFRARSRPGPTGEVPDLIRSIAAEEGIDVDFALRVADIESRFDPKAQNPNSSASGLYQFIDDTWAGLGGGDKSDAALSTRRFAELTRQNATILERRLGRQPEPWEMYLAHQQGAGRASELLSNPSARAADLVGADAVRLNGGREDMTAGEFAGLWHDKYGAAGGPAVRQQGRGPREREPIRWEVDADRAAEASASPEATRLAPRTDPLSDAFGVLDERAGAGRRPDVPSRDVSAGPADRQAPDASGTGAAAARAPERPSVASGLRFIDPSHERLYDLGKRADAGQVDADEAADLVRSMGRFLDLGDDARLSKRERQLWRSERFIYPRRMIEIARDFARQADAPENREAPVSYYDPEAYDTIMLERASPAMSQGGRLAITDGRPAPKNTVGTIDDVLSAASLPPADRPARVRFAEPSEWLAAEARNHGLELTNFQHTIDSDAVRHIRRQHGDPAIEAQRGLAPVGDEHIRAIPDVVAQPDLVAFGLKGPRGEDRIGYLKHLPDGSTILLEQARTGRRELATMTMVRFPGVVDKAALAHFADPYGRTGAGVDIKIVAPDETINLARPDGSIGRRAAHEDPTRSSGRPEDSSPNGGEAGGGQSSEGTIDSPAEDGPAVAAPEGSPDRPAGPKMRAEAEGRKLGSSGVARSGLRDAPQPDAVRTADRKPYKGPTITELANRLRSTLGITHRQGRVTGRRALGEYDTRTAVVRTKSMQEIDVLAHEAMHALEFKKSPALAAALKAHKAEVAPLDYDAMRGDIHEGFAEFGRWYITNPDVARRQAPKFYDAFEAAMEKDFPKALADLKAIQAAYRELLKTDSLSLAAASVAYTGRGGAFSRAVQMVKERGVRGAIQDALDKTYTALVDDLHPLSVTVRELTELVEQHTGRPLDLKFAKNPYALARLARDSYGAGFVDVMDGVVPYRGVDPEGPSLAEALEKALGERGFSKWSEQRLRELDGYLIARRMRHEWQRYADGELQRAPDKYSQAYHEAVIAQAERENPTWAEAAEIIYDWNSRLWQKELDAGLITAETHAAGLEKVDYVPLNRDVSDKRGPGGGRGGRDMRFAGGARRFKGSTRDVISPLTSMMKRAYQVNALVKRNDVLKALDDLSRLAGPGGGRFVERLPANEIERVQVDLREAFENAAKAQGLSVRDITAAEAFIDTILDPEAKASIFRQRGMEPKANEAVVFVWRDGKKIPLLLGDGEFGRELYSAIAGMNKEQQGVFMDVASSFTQALRLGVTLSPEFMARNIIRDQVATWINTDVGYIPGLSFVRGAVEQARQGPMAQRYAAAGGMRGGLNTSARNRPFPHTDAEAQAMLQDLRKKGYRVRVYKPWTLKGLAAMTDLSETGTRLGVMSGAFKAAKKRGLDDYEAVTEAAYVARDYLDFGRRGSRMLSAVRLVTFLNAQIQGMDKAARVLTAGGNLRRVMAPLGKAAPRTDAEKRALAHAYKAWFKLAALATFGGTLASLYADDPEYQEFGDRVRSTHWFFKKGEDWIAIPKPFELAIPSNIIEREILARAMEDPTQRTKMVTDLAYTLAPPTGIPAAEVPIQIATNRGYEGRPIVPDHLRGTVDPELQYNAFTSKVSRAISKAIGDFTDTFGERRTVSPAVIDHVITGFGGSLGRHGLQASDVAIEGATGAPRTATGPEDVFLARAFFRDAARGSSSQAEFWDAVSKDGGDLTRAEGSFRAHMRDGRDAEAIAYLNSLDPNERAFVQARVFSKDGTSKLHPLVRATEVLPVLSRLRQNVRDDELTTIRGQAIELTPDQRRRADDALSALAVAEMRNALVLASHKGWENREMMKRQPLMDDLKAIDPRLPGLVLALQDEAKIPRAPAMSRAWRQLRPRLEAPVEEGRMQQNMDVKRSREGDRRARREQAIRMYQRRETELAQ